jgi:UDP-galactopyranose mutase
MIMKKYDFLIVGAGLYGAVFAREAADAGRRCLVIDRRDHIAGNIYTEEIEGISVHRYGAHIFHTADRRVWDYLSRFTTFNRFTNSPLAVYRDELYNLPFNMNTFHALFGVKTPEQAIERMESERAAYATDAPKNLEEQALSLVGKTVYEKLIRGYTEKQWGRDCRDLPSFIIRRLPLRFTYDNNYFSDPLQGIPEDGYTAMVARMLDGIEVRLGCDFFSDREGYLALADKVIFTGMIDAYYGYRFGTLGYRSLRFETETLNMPNYQGNAVVNYTEREIPYTRIIEHKHFAFGNQEKTVITREYPADWKPGDEPYYPINNDENNALYAKYAALAESEPQVIFGGRLGLYRYLDMHQVVAAALDTAKAVLGGS